MLMPEERAVSLTTIVRRYRYFPYLSAWSPDKNVCGYAWFL